MRPLPQYLMLGAAAAMGCLGIFFLATARNGLEAEQHTQANDPPAAEAQAKPAFPAIKLSPIFSLLEFKQPVQYLHAPDGSERAYVVERGGKVRSFLTSDPKVKDTAVYLDLSQKVLTSFVEEGLLDMTFHPKYVENGWFFVCYSAGNPRRNVLSRFKVSATNPLEADKDSEKVLLEVEQPYANHNGCCLTFGADGFLYASFGDGGSAGDPKNNGQNLATLLGSIIRIDVDRPGDTTAYSIPPDNPFASADKKAENKDARGEIWAYGLRNVWRMSFDPHTAKLWAGDVGQNSWEEVNIIEKGGNYGWRIREGKHDYSGEKTSKTLIDPIHEYGRRDGISITGGRVYRGKNPKLEGLVAAYIFGDYGSGRIWGLCYDDGKVSAQGELLDTDTPIAAFGQDQKGELVVVGFDGKLYRIEAKDTEPKQH